MPTDGDARPSAGRLIASIAGALAFVQGLGTPAPVMPPERLVVTGLYRYVRNPMYVAILWMLAGQGLLMGNRALVGYALVVALMFHLWVIAYEEPTLRDKFGAEYHAYCASVRRWWPRWRPWSP